MHGKTVFKIFNKYVKGTEKHSIVKNVQVFLCTITQATAKAIMADSAKVHISSRVLKHLYDKRTAQEFDFLLEHIKDLIKFPDRIYKNKNGKRGAFCFVRKIKSRDCLCSLEIVSGEFEIVTFFRVSEGCLDDYELLWRWKGGEPSS